MSWKVCSNRHGYSLAETLIAMIVGTLVLASMLGTLIHQQRFYMVATDIAETRKDVALIETVLAPEFLPLNPSAGDIVYAGADSLRMRVYRGVYSVCDKKVMTDVHLTVRPVVPGIPAIGADSALVYSRGTLVSLSDDHWQAVKVNTVSAGTCPEGDASWSAIVQGLNGVLSQIPVGSPVRAFRYASYWIAAEDGYWVVKSDNLGAPRTIGARLMPSSEPKASALRFRYFDAAGNVTTDLSQIVEVEIDVGGKGIAPTYRGGGSYSTDTETLLRLRNAG